MKVLILGIIGLLIGLALLIWAWKLGRKAYNPGLTAVGYLGLVILLIAGFCLVWHNGAILIDHFDQPEMVIEDEDLVPEDTDSKSKKVESEEISDEDILKFYRKVVTDNEGINTIADISEDDRLDTIKAIRIYRLCEPYFDHRITEEEAAWALALYNEDKVECTIECNPLYINTKEVNKNNKYVVGVDIWRILSVEVE